MRPCPRHSLIIAALLLLALGATGAQAGEADLSIASTLDKAVIRVGDIIHYSLVIEANEECEIKVVYPGEPPPDARETEEGCFIALLSPGLEFNKFIIRDFTEGAVDRDQSFSEKLSSWIGDRTGTAAAGKTRAEYHFTITSYFTGDLMIPPMPVMVRFSNGTGAALSTESARVRVAPFTSPEDLTIKDVKAPVAVEVPIITYLPYLAGLVLAAVAFVAVVWLLIRRQAEEEAPEEVRPAHEVALAELRALEAEDYIVRGEYEKHYTRLSYITRKYLATRFLFYALEHTTPEIVEELMDKAIEHADHERARRLIEEADLVKFARVNPDPKDRDSALGRARELVERTRERPPEQLEISGREAA